MFSLLTITILNDSLSAIYHFALKKNRVSQGDRSRQETI